MRCMDIGVTLPTRFGLPSGLENQNFTSEPFPPRSRSMTRGSHTSRLVRLFSGRRRCQDVDKLFTSLAQTFYTPQKSESPGFSFAGEHRKCSDFETLLRPVNNFRVASSRARKELMGNAPTRTANLENQGRETRIVLGSRRWVRVRFSSSLISSKKA